MNILIFGSDSTVHAFAWKLINSRDVQELMLAPGNGGTSFFAPSLFLAPGNPGEVATFVLREAIDLVVADIPSIAAGLPDELGSLPLPVVGSSRQLYTLHTSRTAAREWLHVHGLSVPRGRVCATQAEAEKVAVSLGLPIQVAAAAHDGPTITCTNRTAVPEAIGECLAASGDEGIVVEEVVSGPIVTASLLTDGAHSVSVPPTRLYRSAANEHRTAAAGDKVGPWGVHSAATPLWKKLDEFLEAQVRQPLQKALTHDGRGARGWISTTCVVSERGPVVRSLQLVPSGLELAATLPRLNTDLLPLLVGCARGTLFEVAPPQWSQQAVVGVALRRMTTVEGVGDVPTSAFESFEPGVLVFHHSTTPLLPNTYGSQSGRYGGRAAGKGTSAWSSLLGLGSSELSVTGRHSADTTVAVVVAIADTVAAARERVYSNLRRSNIEKACYSDDIGVREL